jgi:Rrf2 family transcriptional regulator, nitric oxide-sensitive transcriptional repressor
MRLTTRTNLATRALMACAVNEDIILRSADIAARTNASLNHMLQVVNTLQEFGFVQTIRGRTGGLRLSRPAAQIIMGDVFRIFESNIAFAECFDANTNTCPLINTCRLKSYLARAVEAFFHEMDQVSLHDLVVGNCGLSAMLQMDDSPRASCQKAQSLVMA